MCFSLFSLPFHVAHVVKTKQEVASGGLGGGGMPRRNRKAAPAQACQPRSALAERPEEA